MFVLLSALALPLTRRRGIPAGRLFWLAVVMTAAIILTWEVIIEAVTATATAKVGPAHPLGNGIAIPGASSVVPGSGSVRVPIIVISAAIMVLVIATAAALLRLIGVKPTPSPPPIDTALPPEAPPRGHRPAPPHKARHRAVL